MSNHFFEEQSEQSQVKATIVSKYFWAWASIISRHLAKNEGQPRIAYIDLFAGPGRYKDGASSTPLLILEEAVKNPKFCRCLVTYFNDKDEAASSSLRAEIDKIPGINKLKYAPVVYNEEVGEEVVKMFEQLNLVPTLFFVDPWGYKGLSLRLINSVLKDWACECIFFFNYTRINMGLSNPLVSEHMEALFGEQRAERVAKKLEHLPPVQRELTVLEEICQALKEMGGKYVLPFRFKNANGNRTSHHLVFVSKHHLGYDIMKEIMAKESSTSTQGVASFEYNPADERQRLLFGLTRSLDDLEGSLLDTFAGETRTVAEVFSEHNVDTPFILRNYKAVLMDMHQRQVIHAERPSGKPIRRNTFPEDIEVTFPED